MKFYITGKAYKITAAAIGSFISDSFHPFRISVYCMHLPPQIIRLDFIVFADDVIH